MRRFAPALLAAAVALSALAALWAQREPITQTDEAAWLFSTYYYRLVFMDHDFRSPAWRHEDAYDHPPLAKLYYGAWAASAGGVPDSLAGKERWFVRTDDVHDFDRFLQELNAAIPRPQLLRARLGAAAAMAAACALIGLVGALAAGPWAGAAACILTALLPLTLRVGCQVLADEPLAALLSAGALTQTLLARRLWRGEPWAWSAAAAGEVIGLAFDTKISAAAEAVILPLSLLLALPHARWKDASRAALVAGAAAALTAYACDPSLWPDPLGFAAEMFEHRLAVLTFQRRLFVQYVNPSLPYRVSEMLKGMFTAPDAFAQLTGLLAAGLCCAALETLPRRWRETAAEGWRRVPVAHALAWIAVSGWTYHLRIDRYLMPAAPFVGLLAALGAASLQGAPPKRLALMAGLLLAIGSFCSRFDTLRYWRSHPLERDRALLDSNRALCEHRPDLCR